MAHASRDNKAASAAPRVTGEITLPCENKIAGTSSSPVSTNACTAPTCCSLD